MLHSVFARAVPIAVLLCTLGMPAVSEAATYVLRPENTVSNNWTVTPSGPSAWEVLDDAVLQPTAPSTASDFVTTSTVGAVAEVHLATQPIAPGDTVSTTTAWAYIRTGTRRSVTFALTTNTTTLATTTVPAGSAAAWRSVSTSTALSQSQIDGLRLKFTTNSTGGGAATANFVYAGYASMLTNGVMSESSSASPSFSATLDGTDQAETYDVPISVIDTRNTSSGWNLSASTTQFSTGGGNPSTLPANASRVTAATSSCAQAPCVAPTNSVNYPVTITAGQPAVKFFNAASSTGSGQHTITPTTTVSIPANADTGSYSSTVTYTLASGP